MTDEGKIELLARQFLKELMRGVRLMPEDHLRIAEMILTPLARDILALDLHRFAHRAKTRMSLTLADQSARRRESITAITAPASRPSAKASTWPSPGIIDSIRTLLPADRRRLVWRSARIGARQ
jgi:hypothetical protein